MAKDYATLTTPRREFVQLRGELGDQKLLEFGLGIIVFGERRNNYNVIEGHIQN